MGLKGLTQKLKNIAQGYYYANKHKFTQDLPRYFMEQVYYRMSKCPGCVKLGKCYSCKCYSPELFFAPEKKCAQGHWPAMMNEPEWNAFTKINNLNFDNDFISESPTGLGDEGDTRPE